MDIEQQLADIAGKPDQQTKVYQWHAEDEGVDFALAGILRQGEAIGDDPEDGYEYEIVVGGNSYVNFRADHVEKIDYDTQPAFAQAIKLI